MITAKEMQPGDIIEFLSDKQTDKGPSSGCCVSNDGEYVTLRHSDVGEDKMLITALEVSYCHNRPDCCYWALV